jgi:energy-coupling factor transporter ATP-binding protein EcfA2
MKEETLSVKSIEDVEGVFKKYKYEGGIYEEEVTEDKGEIKKRIEKYLEELGKSLGETEQEKQLKEVIPVVLKGGYEKFPPIHGIIVGMLNNAKIKVKVGEVTLKGYPHIHMAVGFTTKTGTIRDLNELTRKIQKCVSDVDFRKKDGTSTGRKKGRKIDIGNDAKIMGYVLKNARHETTMEKIERTPVVVYNYKNEPNVTKLFGMLYEQTGVALSMDTSVREKTEIKVAFTLEIINPEPTSGVTNLASTVTNKPIAKTKKSKMMNMVKTYLEKNQMAITPRGTIYQRIRESKKSWKYWGTPEQLYAEMCDPENFELLDSTRKQFFTYTTGEFKKLLPYVDLDFQWIEFKDFIYNLTTSEIVRENIEREPYESFAYIPETEYGDIYPELRKKPERWFEILRNSGYMEGEQLTEKGKELISAVNDIYRPKTHKSKSIVLYGDSNSGKTSLIDPIYNIYPKDARMKITAAGGFELAGLVMRPQFVVSDEHDKGRLRRDQTLILVEGDVEMALNIKHRNTETVKVEARSAFICNEIEWAMKEETKDRSLLTFENAVSGQQIENKREIDKAYENRLLFCRMNEIPERKCSSIVRKEMIQDEKGLIPLYVGKMIYGENAFKIKV